uniref:Putative cytochrome n=1 Tax=Nyssomyia neivai TaxID=330878 RepID=A0A1L8E431_9DIPT
MDLTVLLVFLVTFVIVGYLYVKKKQSYWEKHGVPYVNPAFLIGNLWGVGTSKHFAIALQDNYRELKGKDVIGGIYFLTDPVALILDMDLMKNILIKDFQYFHDRGVYVNERDDPLSGHLFSLPGQKWKLMRAKLSPTFTSGKMKMMHSTIIAVADEFKKFLEPYGSRNEEVEIKEMLACFTTDVIGSCAFGIECNSLKEPNTEFRRVGKQVFEFSGLSFAKQIAIQTFPKLAKSLRMSITPPDVTNFFMKLLRETIDYREANNVNRSDFLSLMIQLKNTGKLEGDNVDLGKLTFEELAAQTFVFFVAGFETSSSTMAFALYELALNEEIQERAREEVNAVLEKHGGEFTYEACMELKYLDRVIQETLRKYPIVDNLMRVATNDYNVPGTKHVIPKGMGILIPVYGIHRDPEIYPNPERFDPDRFTDENIKQRHPMAWLPFGEGPRICVGMRFGLMQTRVGLATILSKYRLKATQKTPIPMTYAPLSAFISPPGGMWLKIEKLSS